ncbi:hypothetical protein JCM6882_006532, partial [Rhodosporidiobolus microsporus]
APPLSPILFLLYNAALLLLARTPSSCGFGWVDDLNLLVWGNTVEEAVAAAQELVPGLEEWSDSHFSAFEPSKTLVTIFTPRNTKLPSPLPHIILRGVELAYSPSLTMLGTILDEHLTFAVH